LAALPRTGQAALLKTIREKPGGYTTGYDEALHMTEATEDEVLAKAGQLAHEDGRLWLWVTEDSDPGEDGRARIVDESLRVEYLNRARELLRREKL
jgi:hypothetical protein